MKKNLWISGLSAALALALAGCGSIPAAENNTGAAAPQVTASAPTPAEDAQTALPTVEAPAAESGRRDGERFDAFIMLEGMEETVHYEHIINNAIGFAMDYDYESFSRQSFATCERFISIWDDPAQPENYLELNADTKDAALVAETITAVLSNDYDVYTEYRELAHAGRCIYLEASVIKGTNQMANQLQTVYIIPASHGCLVATAHYSIEAAEGFGRRFAYMLNTLSPIGGNAEKQLTDEQALAAIRQYCLNSNPDLESIVNAGEYPVYWEISSSDAKEIAVLFRSYTGALVSYHVDRATGETFVTEAVPGVTNGEQQTDERLNAWEYLS